MRFTALDSAGGQDQRDRNRVTVDVLARHRHQAGRARREVGGEEPTHRGRQRHRPVLSPLGGASSRFPSGPHLSPYFDGAAQQVDVVG